MQQIRLIHEATQDACVALADAFDDLCEDRAWPTALFERDADSPVWCYAIYVPEGSEADARALLADHASDAGFVTETLGDVDWIAATLRQLAPVRAGRFLVHGSHDREAARNAPVAVEIDAGQAFGTGHHGTTAGCLDAFERVLRRSFPSTIIDVGAGSGVLAIAAAKACRVPALASDIDPVAQRVAAQNARSNGVAAFVRSITATGFGHPAFGRFGRADVIFANILARPLEHLARPLAAQLVPGGTAILSGLLPHQRARIVAAYRTQGLVLEKATVREGWLTIAMRKPDRTRKGRRPDRSTPSKNAPFAPPDSADWTN